MKKKALLLFLSFITASAFAASVNVDELNIIADTHYNIDSQSIENNTYFKFLTSFDGGYKFSSQIAFEANTKELEKSYRSGSADFYNKVFMLFRHAEVTARNLADSHFDLSLWTGTHKYLGAGAKYRGFIYYPESVETDYEGYYRMRGTGITAGIKFWEEKFRANFHFYQNTNFVTEDNPSAFYYFSFDNEIGLYFDDIPFDKDFYHFMVELTYGATFPIGTIGQYKAGFTFGVGNNYFDFFLSFGVPKIDANAANMSFDDFYLASDIHFILALTDNTISFLTRPFWFNEEKSGLEKNGEKTDFDVNYKFFVNLPNNILRPGLNLNFKYSLTDTEDPWNLTLTTFLDISFSGIFWNIGAHYDFSRIYIGNLKNYDTRIYLEGIKIIVGAKASF